MLIAFHLLSTLSLLTAAIVVRCGNKKAEQFLLPFSILSFLGGIALLAPFAMEIFVANYSGAIYETEPGATRAKSLQWLILFGNTAIPMLPGLALFPFIRNRPLVVAALASSALLSAISCI